MSKTQKYLLAILAPLLCAGCQNANVTVTGLSGSGGTPISASGANPINAASYGAAVGTTTGTSPNYILKMKLSSQQINPNAATPGGYTIRAKAVKW